MNRSFGCLLVLCFVLETVKEASGQTRPFNAVTESGGEVIFNCSGTSFQPNWLMSKDGTTANHLVIAGSCDITPGMENHYRTEETGEPLVCNLIVLSITMEQAGVYWCSDGVTSPSYALLTVIDSSSTMTFNNTPDVMETEIVTIICSLNYNGSVSPAPTLRPHYYWTNVNGQNVSDFIVNVTENKAVSELSARAGREDIASHTCHLYLELDPPRNGGYANNTPTVNISTSSPPIAVLYGIGPISIKNSTVDGDVILTCTTTGNPAPNYYWTSSNDITNRTVQAIQTKVVGYFECNATNVIRNYTYSNASEVNVTQDCVRTDYVLVTVIPYLMKNLIVFVIFIICINCNKDFRCRMTTQFKWLMKLHRCSKGPAVEIVFCVCFIIGSLAIGLLMIPIFITIALCKGHDTSNLEMHSGVNQTEQDPKEKDPAEHDIVIQTGTKPGSRNKCMLVLMWCLVLVALVPISFIVVYCGPCQEERLVVA